ncbi:dicarboxylate/amino acid:cation symporter [Tessaracoccus sp. MC1865]|uniref:dicarboxylate/amino acid:cation symporter n=1 Tax=Tessaracoccus sp. MC1865 TaxID=2760310 RepID=UPI0016020507|nr:dicarboxylate/amino acid:cation symporter [Tessaracoccus sp. MC1865]MBB1482996.1 dicarboxylate/amino acid:cation symporter [Tessaracoccus sp. MC1865]QTO37568.1 dicarboxylate/amino acid:cation symporter [Tessaracoccus sp. MC1865]
MSAETTRPRKFSFGLLPQIVAAIVLGVLLGTVLPDWVTRIFVTFNGLFGQFLGFAIPLIILGLIAPAIADLGRGAGKWLAITAGLAYLSTLLAGFMGYGASMLVLPRVLPADGAQSLTNPEESLLAPFFELPIPPLFGVTTAVVLAFVVGIALTVVEGGALLRGFRELRDLVNWVIAKIIIPLLPIYIFGIFLNMTQGGQVATVIVTFLGVVVFVFILTWIMLVLQFLVAGAVVGRNPFRMLLNMLPAYATALGTSSSAATIPVTLRSTLKNGVSQPVAAFAVPLCATIHLAGSMIKITCFSIAVMMLSGSAIQPGLMIAFIFMLGVMMVAAPGVPGGAIMTAVGLLSSMLGFTDAQVGLMIATYIAIDSFGTATNVTGDGAIAAIIDKWVRSSKSQEQLAEESAAKADAEAVDALAS